MRAARLGPRGGPRTGHPSPGAGPERVAELRAAREDGTLLGRVTRALSAIAEHAADLVLHRHQP